MKFCRKLNIWLMGFYFSFCLLICFAGGGQITALANSAQPMRADKGGGIVFAKHEQVQINGEVLNIKLNNDSTADISATYRMKNSSPDTLSIETMFLTPVMYGENKDIHIQRNDYEIDFTQEFFAPYNGDKVDLDDWEGILANAKTRTSPLGDGGGFFEYTIYAENNNARIITFVPGSYYFYKGAYNATEKGGAAELKGWGNIILATEQDLDLDTDLTVEKRAIEDIYDYLFDKMMEGSFGEWKLEIAASRFNYFLFQIEESVYGYKFGEIWWKSCVAAIVYYVDFAPYEEVELKVSYVYQMGVSGYRRTAELFYYLSPAKYWKDFSGIEINITMCSKFIAIKDSSLKFTKIDKEHYQYKSATLPKNDLKITFTDGSLAAVCGCATTNPGTTTLTLILYLLAISPLILKKKKVRPDRRIAKGIGDMANSA